MSQPRGLTESQRALLMALDGVLLQTSPEAHVMAAKQITKLWSEQHSVFQSQLVQRAELWRRRQVRVDESWRDQTGACDRLMELLAVPGDIAPGVRAPRRGTNKKPNRRHPKAPISDEEVRRFLRLIDEEGLEAVFDPGVLILDGTLLRKPLIVLDKNPIYYEDIFPAYEQNNIERSWDSEQRVPEIALAMDLVLLVMAQERKWTWHIADRILGRLPRGHPYKATPGERPGWKLLTKMLEAQRLIECRRGQTWRLTREARVAVLDLLRPMWISLTQPESD